MPIDVQLLLSLVALVAIAWRLYKDRHAKRATQAARDFAWKAFREVSVESENAQHAFCGATCRVLKVEETGVAWDMQDPTFGNYVLAIFAANEAQEVFHFRFSAGKGFLKPVAPAVARAVLGTAAPAEHGAITGRQDA